MTIRIKDDLVRNYKDYYSGTSEWRNVTAISMADNIVSMCADLPHNLILDIGAGEGAVLQRLAELKFGDKYFAVEISQSGVDAIKSRDIPFLSSCDVFDGYTLPYADKQFDLVILSHVVEHLEYPRRLIYESSRVARYCFVEVPLEYTLTKRRDFRFTSVGHINFFTDRSLRWLIQSCGMKVIDQKVVIAGRGNYFYRQGYTGLFKFYFKRLLLGLAPPIASYLMTYMGILVFTDNTE